MTTSNDSIYAKHAPHLVDFAFDQRVVNVFPDMIRRSVPAYETIVPLCALIAVRSLPPLAPDAVAPPVVYDLGCSRGATTAALLTYAPPDVTIVGVDNSTPMIEAARDGIAGLTSSAAATRVEWRCEDIQQTDLSGASAVVMTYTLQFIPLEEREDQLRRILDGLRPGAPFVYAEKVVLDDGASQQWAETMHHDFKLANGYSELEVAQKRSAIERIMIPESIGTHLERMQRLGFERVNQWFSCLNWAAFIGYAPGTDAALPPALPNNQPAQTP